MFVFLILLTICLCVLSVYTVYKILELEKDVNTLYDNYAKELEKITLININKDKEAIRC